MNFFFKENLPLLESLLRWLVQYKFLVGNQKFLKIEMTPNTHPHYLQVEHKVARLGVCIIL